MKGLRRTLAFLMLLSCMAFALPKKDKDSTKKESNESPRSLYNKGVKAEAHQDYEAAYDFYKAAYDKHPEDLKYRLPYERMRSLASAAKIRRGQKLRELGRFEEALAMFEKAMEVDSSNDLAQQEIRRTKEIMAQPPPGTKTDSGPPEVDELHRRLDEAAGPVRLTPLVNVPSTLKMTGDSKVIYETLGKLAGLNVLFDPEYNGKRLGVDLQGVSLQQALDIVALESRTFWRPVTPNTIFVAADSQAKRRELEQSVIKTFYLGNVSAPTDLQDVVNAIRTILEVQRIQQIPSQNAIVVRGTPDQLALAQKMIDDIDKSKPEVIVEIVVAQVRRDKVRNLGLLPPQNASVTLVPNSTTATTTTPGTGGTTTTPAANTSLNFNNLQHLNSTNYSVSFGSLTAQALFNDNNTKILQNPQIRAGDGVKASLKIGDRIPVATGSFGTPTGIAGVGNLGVNTQFQYLDVGVNIDITPHVHPDGEITLKVALDVSSQTGTATIGNVTQPIISQRKVEHEIRLRDGEVSLLGGILEEQDVQTTNGTPFLSQIPILKYLFSANDKEKHLNEVVFMLIPRIVRGQELSSLNRRTLDVGSGTGIELRVAEKPVKPEAAAAPAVKPNQPAQPGVTPVSTPPAPAKTPAQQTQTPAQTTEPPAPNKPPVAGGTVIRLEPSTANPPRNTTFGLNVVVGGAQDITSFPIEISYDPKLVQFITVSAGGFLAKDGQAVVLNHRDDPAAGTLRVNAMRPPGMKGVGGDGTVFTITFMAKSSGSGTINIVNAGPKNSQNAAIQATTSGTAVTVP